MKRIFKSLTAIGLAVAVALTPAVSVFATTTEAIEVTSVTTPASDMGAPQYWSVSASGSTITADFYDSSVADGYNAVLSIGEAKKGNVVSFSGGHVTATLDLTGVWDGEYTLWFMKSTAAYGNEYESAVRTNIRVHGETAVFYFAGGKSEHAFLDEISSYDKELYNSIPSKMDEIDQDYTEIIDKAKSLVSASDSDLTKLKKIHDWITTNIAYDFESLEASLASGKQDDLAYAASATCVYENRRAVCSGYSRLMRLMLGAVGIPCLNVTGYASGGAGGSDEKIAAGVQYDTTIQNHEWNLVYVGGKWRIVDATWDSQNRFYGEGDERNVVGLSPNYQYFGIAPESFGADHVSVGMQNYIDNGEMKYVDYLEIFEDYTTVYNTNQDIKFDGTVVAHYTDGTSATLNNDDLVCTYPETTSPGVKTVTVEYYELSSSGKRVPVVTYDYTVTINEITLTGDVCPYDSKNGTDFEKIEAFIWRMYKLALGRATVGEHEIIYWSSMLYRHEKTGADMAFQFCCGEEFRNRGLSDDDYSKILYQVYMDRERGDGDADGWTIPMSQGVNRKWIMAQFVNSPEYTKICWDYGIDRGTLDVPEDEKYAPN